MTTVDVDPTTQDASTSAVVWFPLMFDLTGRRVVVVGGGPTAEDKVRLLVQAAADIVVIAPTLTESLEGDVSSGRIAVRRREFAVGDLVGATLAIAATDDPGANSEVAREAAMLGVPINAVDDPERCSVIFPSVHRDGPLVVAVSTSGAAPAVAVRLRERIAEMTVGYGSWLDTLREFRGQIRGRFTTFAERRDVWYRIADSPPVADAGRRGEQSTTRRLVQDVIDDFATNVCVKSAVIESDAVRRAERRIEEALAVSRSPVITCSMQVGGLVLVDLVRGRAPDVRVVFVDTGYHFSETLAFRDRVADEWDLQIDVVGPGPEVREPLDGPPLHITDPVRCCQLRKVAPADGAIAGHDLWLSSLRRIQGTSRASVPADAEHVLTDGSVIRKVHPLVDWSWADVVAYADARGVPRHPLYDGGYSSIGCEPCTVPTFSQGDDRRGRWDGSNVQECGLHISKGRS